MVVVLTEREYEALRHIINNGWGDGDFSGYGNANPRTQISAMKQFEAASPFDVETVNVKDARRDQNSIVQYRYRAEHGN